MDPEPDLAPEMVVLDLGAPEILRLRIDADGTHLLWSELPPDRIVELLRAMAYLVESGRLVPPTSRT